MSDDLSLFKQAAKEQDSGIDGITPFGWFVIGLEKAREEHEDRWEALKTFVGGFKHVYGAAERRKWLSAKALLAEMDRLEREG